MELGKLGDIKDDLTQQLWCDEDEYVVDEIKPSDLRTAKSIPVVLSLYDNHTFLGKWLDAVENIISDCLYADWRELYFELYELASDSSIFDGRQQSVVVGRMLILLIVTNLSKRALGLADCMRLFGVPNKLYDSCISSLFAFMRHMFDFPLHRSRDFNMSDRFHPEGGNSQIIFATPKIQSNVFSTDRKLVLKALHNDDNGDFDYTVFVEIIAHYKLFKRYGPQTNLSNLLGFFSSRNHVWLVLPRYQYSFDMFFESARATQANVRRAFKQLCEAIQKLHDIDISHRDIKLHNIMFDSNWDLVLIDFGLCSLSNSTCRQTFPVCTVTTRAPEQLFHEQKKDSPLAEFDGKKIDIWSIGCMLSAFGHNKADYIFPGTTEKALKNSIPRILRDFDTYVNSHMQKTLGDEGVALMKRLLCVNPDDRPTIAEVLADSYFFDEEEVKTKI